MDTRRVCGTFSIGVHPDATILRISCTSLERILVIGAIGI